MIIAQVDALTTTSIPSHIPLAASHSSQGQGPFHTRVIKEGLWSAVLGRLLLIEKNNPSVGLIQADACKAFGYTAQMSKAVLGYQLSQLPPSWNESNLA